MTNINSKMKTPKKELTCSHSRSSCRLPEALLLDDETGTNESTRQQRQNEALQIVRRESHSFTFPHNPLFPYLPRSILSRYQKSQSRGTQKSIRIMNRYWKIAPFAAPLIPFSVIFFVHTIRINSGSSEGAPPRDSRERKEESQLKMLPVAEKLSIQ